jgi:predicted dehydrogenase
LEDDVIRVGIIGASPDRGWASRAHVPALQAVEGYRLTAVATTRQASAQQAASQFGAEHAFTDPQALAAHPEVDLVVITVKVPAHKELVHNALDAGKHVLCEWPLALDTAEAIGLAKAARDAGVIAVTGLQTRFAPAVAYARELIAEGHIGTVTSATLLSTRAKGGDGRVPAWASYTFDRSMGAGSLEVMGGHAFDAVEYILGEFVDVSATLAIQHPKVTIAETGQPIHVTSPDHIAVHGTLTGGAVVSAQLRDAESAPPRTRLEIAGQGGNLAIVSRGGASWEEVQFSIGDLGLRTTVDAAGGWRDLDIPARHRVAPAITATGARNVSRLYERLLEDLRTGDQHTPSFDSGVHLHQLLDTIRRSSESRISRG